jgi:hypothetical protein
MGSTVYASFTMQGPNGDKVPLDSYKFLPPDRLEITVKPYIETYVVDEVRTSSTRQEIVYVLGDFLGFKEMDNEPEA